MKRKYIVVFPLLALILASLACGDSNNGTKVDATAQKTSEATAPAQQQTFSIGDVVAVKDHKITLNSATYSGGILKANFTIENTGTEDVSVSSLMEFTAKLDDGTKLENSIFDCGSSLDGKVLPNDKLKGDICWELKTLGKVKIYYESDMFSSGATVWVIDPNNLSDSTAQSNEIAPQDQSTQSSSDGNSNLYKVGDVIELQNQFITLNSATITNNVLKTNFTIENTGKDDLTVSSMLSFYAKDREGTKLEMDLFDCGTSMDGKVLAGDKLKGDICWKTGGANGIKIYYEADLFSSGAIVWSIE